MDVKGTDKKVVKGGAVMEREDEQRSKSESNPLFCQMLRELLVSAETQSQDFAGTPRLSML